MGVKHLVHEADHSLSSNVKVKNVWNYTSMLPVRLHGMVLNYARDRNFIFDPEQKHMDPDSLSGCSSVCGSSQ
jgi:hypothetical protein